MTTTSKSKEIMFYDHLKSTNSTNTQRFRFNELMELYLEIKNRGIPEVSDKLSNKLFSPCEYVPEEDIILTKNGNTRAKHNVKRFHLAVIDFDDGTQEDLEEIEKRIADYRYIKYSSYRCDPKNNVLKYRYLLELDKPIPPSQLKAYMLFFDYKFTKNKNDKACSSISQAFYVPANNVNLNFNCEISYNDGKCLEVHEEYTKESDDSLLRELASFECNVDRAENITKSQLAVLSEKLSESSNETKKNSGLVLKELINTGNFSEDIMGNHDAFLKVSSTVGRAFPNMNPEVLVDLFSESQQDKKNNYNEHEMIRNLMYGFEQGAKYTLLNKEKQKENAISNLENISEDILTRCNEKHMNIAPSDFYKYLIIVVGKSYYIYHPKKRQYIKYSKDHTMNAIKQTIENVNICGEHGIVKTFDKIETSKGEVYRPKSMEQLISEHGYVCTEVKGFMDSQHEHEYFNPHNEIFYEQLLKRRELAPKYNENVDKWLKALCGNKESEYRDLCKWISFGLTLNDPLSILYLAGAASTGKSMFGTIMSRNWTTEGFTPAHRVLGQLHNAQIKDCPMVVADEALPTNVEYGNIADILREFVSNDNHTLRLMHTDGYKIKGYLRLVLAANNPNLLSIKGEQTPEDIEAVAMRFFYLKVSKKAAKFLAQLNKENWSEISTWKKGDVGIAHFRWIEQNTDISERDRFGISKGEDYIRQIIRTNGAGADILSALISYVTADPIYRESDLDSDNLFIDQHMIWCNFDGLKQCWPKLTDVKMPKPGTVASKLAAHSNEKTRHSRNGSKKKLLFPVKVQEIVDYSIRSKYSDPETILLGLGYMPDTIEAFKLDKSSIVIEDDD